MQNSEEDQFLFETSVQTSVQDTISQLAHVYNLRHRITRLKLEGEELAKYGPAKHPEQQGIDQYSDQAVDKGEFYKMDPTGRRTGNGRCSITCIILLSFQAQDCDQPGYLCAADTAPHAACDPELAKSKLLAELDAAAAAASKVCCVLAIHTASLLLYSLPSHAALHCMSCTCADLQLCV